MLVNEILTGATMSKSDVQPEILLDNLTSAEMTG